MTKNNIDLELRTKTNNYLNYFYEEGVDEEKSVINYT
jgi:hypothetical protein